MNLQDCPEKKEIYFELYKRFTRIINFLYDNKLVQANQELQRITSELLKKTDKNEELITFLVNDVSSIANFVMSGSVIQGYFLARDILQKIEGELHVPKTS